MKNILQSFVKNSFRFVSLRNRKQCVRLVSLFVLLLINVTTSFFTHVAGRYEAGVLLAEAGRLIVRLRESQQEKAGETNLFISSSEIVTIRV